MIFQTILNKTLGRKPASCCKDKRDSDVEKIIFLIYFLIERFYKYHPKVSLAAWSTECRFFPYMVTSNITFAVITTL